MNFRDIRSIHDGPFKLVFVSSGGGGSAISDLLKVPGASQTILESYIPYSRESMDEYLGFQPSHYCGLQTTVNMAVTAFNRAKKLATSVDQSYLLGVAVTATLSTTYEKLGSHRFFVCIHCLDATHVISCYLTKGKRTRSSEEELVTECLESLIGIVCGVNNELPKLTQKIEYEVFSSKPEWHALESGEKSLVHGALEPSKLIFPGAFNPLHEGHKRIQEIAEKKTKMPATFEISIGNVEKTLLSYFEIHKVLDQFKLDDRWTLTNAPTFADKAIIFKDSTFVLGVDTLIRMFDQRFYGDQKQMLESLDVFNANDVKFLVFGRRIDDIYKTLDQVSIPSSIVDRFDGIPESEFRLDISSREIKKAQEENKIPA